MGASSLGISSLEEFVEAPRVRVATVLPPAAYDRLLRQCKDLVEREVRHRHSTRARVRACAPGRYCSMGDASLVAQARLSVSPSVLLSRRAEEDGRGVMEGRLRVSVGAVSKASPCACMRA